MLSWTAYKISNTEDVKDVVQDTFFSVAKNISKFNEKSNPKTWIFSILNNKIADFYRKQYKNAKSANFDSLSFFFNENGEWKKDKSPKEWEIDDEQNLLDNLEFIEILNYCIENLPDKFNSVIKLKYYTEKNTQEICQEIGINTTNMWQIMHRAKLKLRHCLESNWFSN